MNRVLLHSHGIAKYDFSSCEIADLEPINAELEERNLDCVITLFLRRDHQLAFREVLHYFDAHRDELPRILGFAIEGPLLGNSGGVPPAGCWPATSEEWDAIAGLGAFGLQYVVLGPDASELWDEIGPSYSLGRVIDKLYESGVRIALGHFQHQHPELSARRTRDVIAHVQNTYGPSPDVILTDHLYNDMPRAFVHAARDGHAMDEVDRDVQRLASVQWSLEAISDLLGPVPAAILDEALNDRIRPVLNFDGEHVDLRVCALTVAFVGSERLALITDNTDAPTMAGESLELNGSRLWRRNDGRVAAGTTGITQQVENLRSIGLSPQDIDNLTIYVPRAVLKPLR